MICASGCLALIARAIEPPINPSPTITTVPFIQKTPPNTYNNFSKSAITALFSSSFPI
ncbi:hypothetical protein NT04LM_2863, partial [Listeria monocytogenes FSL F2-208]